MRPQVSVPPATKWLPTSAAGGLSRRSVRLQQRLKCPGDVCVPGCLARHRSPIVRRPILRRVVAVPGRQRRVPRPRSVAEIGRGFSDFVALAGSRLRGIVEILESPDRLINQVTGRFDDRGPIRSISGADILVFHCRNHATQDRVCLHQSGAFVFDDVFKTFDAGSSLHWLWRAGGGLCFGRAVAARTGLRRIIWLSHVNLR